MTASTRSAQASHERFIVTWDRFNKSVAAKTAKADAKVDA